MANASTAAESLLAAGSCVGPLQRLQEAPLFVQRLGAGSHWPRGPHRIDAGHVLLTAYCLLLTATWATLHGTLTDD